MAKKIEVVEYALKHSIYQACKHFNLSTGTVWPWMKMDFAKEKTVVYRAAGGGRKLSYPTEIEEELVMWVLEQRDLHLAISVRNIIDQAVLTIGPICPSFQGSRGWVQKFMRRNNLTIRAKNIRCSKTPSCPRREDGEFLPICSKCTEANQVPR